MEWLFFKMEQDRIMVQWVDGDETSWARYRTLNQQQKQKRKETWAKHTDESYVPYWMNQYTGARRSHGPCAVSRNRPCRPLVVHAHSIRRAPATPPRCPAWPLTAPAPVHS